MFHKSNLRALLICRSKIVAVSHFTNDCGLQIANNVSFDYWNVSECPGEEITTCCRVYMLQIRCNKFLLRYWHVQMQSTINLPSCVYGLCVYVQVCDDDLPETIAEIWDHLTEEPNRVPESSWRFVTPKFLLDNFCHTMLCLFSDCFDSTEAHQDCKYNIGHVKKPSAYNQQ